MLEGSTGWGDTCGFVNVTVQENLKSKGMYGFIDDFNPDQPERRNGTELT